MKEVAQDEKAMREAKTPWPHTEAELVEYINSLIDRPHDYGTCVYAMSLAASAAFNYVAHKLGATGFQSSYADLDFMRRSRLIDGPFILLKAEDALYPQYDLPGKLEEFLRAVKPWLAEAAQKKLADDSKFASGRVVEHWKRLAESK